MRGVFRRHAVPLFRTPSFVGTKRQRQRLIDDLAAIRLGEEEVSPYFVEVSQDRRDEIVGMSRALDELADALDLRLDPRRSIGPDQVHFYRPLPRDLEPDPSAKVLQLLLQPGLDGLTPSLGTVCYVEENEAVPLVKRRAALSHELIHMRSVRDVVIGREGSDAGVVDQVRTGFQYRQARAEEPGLAVVNEGTIEAARVYAQQHFWPRQQELHEALHALADENPISYVPAFALVDGLVQHAAARHDVPERAVFEGMLRDLLSGEDTTMAPVLAPFAHGDASQRAALRDLCRLAGPSMASTEEGMAHLADLSGRLGLPGMDEKIEAIRQGSVEFLSSSMEGPRPVAIRGFRTPTQLGRSGTTLEDLASAVMVEQGTATTARTAPSPSFEPVGLTAVDEVVSPDDALPPRVLEVDVLDPLDDAETAGRRPRFGVLDADEILDAAESLDRPAQAEVDGAGEIDF